ncbi:hypothetical protein [Parabacteroides distasonis]
MSYIKSIPFREELMKRSSLPSFLVG